MNDHPDKKTNNNSLFLVIKEEQVNISPESSGQIHGAVANKGHDEEYVNIHIRGVPGD